jgi:uncharacterized protein (DUF362 family)
MHNSRIFIESLSNGYSDPISKGLAYLGITDSLRSSDRIAIKPNLTFPFYRKGVMTNPEAVEALVVYLKNFTDRITICESDSGGYNRFSMDEVFSATGLKEMAARYGVAILNLTNVTSRAIQFRRGWRCLNVSLPTVVLDETDLFITMPVPKVHSNTGISVSLKNQWGIIPEPSMRLRLHPYFKEVIYQINKALPKAISIVDGRYGLTRSGPMRGDEVELDWILLGDDLFCVDQVVCRMMGFDPVRIPHLRFALRREGWRDIDFNTDYQRFVSDRFYLERQWTDLPGLLTFNSRALAYVGYESILARPLHWLLYRFREPFY